MTQEYAITYFPTLIMLAFIFVPIIAAVFIGVYVYQDAKSRNMSPIGWTLAAVLAPAFIGLIVYMVVRGSHSNLKCPQCGGPVEPSFVTCPACGCRMKDTCPSCGRALEPTWNVCPDCASPLPEHGDATPPTRKKERGFWGLIAIITVAVLLFVSAIFFLFSNQDDSGETTCYSSETLKVSDLTPALRDWTRDCDQQGPGYYVLSFDGGDDEVMDPLRKADSALMDTWACGQLWHYSHNYAFLIYHSGGKTYYAESMVEQNDDFFPNNYVAVEFNQNEVSPTGNPIFLSYSSDRKCDPEDAVQISDTGEPVHSAFAQLKDGKIIWRD